MRRRKKKSIPPYKADHVVQRLRERYGIDISRRDIEDFTALVKRGEVIPPVHRNLDIRKLEYKGSTIYVLYDRKAKIPATVFTEEQANNWVHQRTADIISRKRNMKRLTPA